MTAWPLTGDDDSAVGELEADDDEPPPSELVEGEHCDASEIEVACWECDGCKWWWLFWVGLCDEMFTLLMTLNRLCCLAEIDVGLDTNWRW